MVVRNLSSSALAFSMVGCSLTFGGAALNSPTAEDVNELWMMVFTLASFAFPIHLSAWRPCLGECRNVMPNGLGTRLLAIFHM